MLFRTVVSLCEGMQQHYNYRGKLGTNK